MNCWPLATVFVAMGTGAKELYREIPIKGMRGRIGKKAREDIKIKKQSSCCKTRLNPHTDDWEPYISIAFT